MTIKGFHVIGVRLKEHTFAIDKTFKTWVNAQMYLLNEMHCKDIGSGVFFQKETNTCYNIMEPHTDQGGGAEYTTWLRDVRTKKEIKKISKARSVDAYYGDRR